MVNLGKTFLRNVFLFLLLVFAAFPMEGIAANENAIRRDIIAFHDGSHTELPDETQLHRIVEFPLNHLGLSASYWDVADGLPDLTTARPNFVVSWFNAPIGNSKAYLDWARRAREAGTKFVVIGHTGMNTENTDAFFRLLGLRTAGYAPITHQSSILMRNPDLVGYECTPDPVLPPYPILKPQSTEIESHLTVTSTSSRLDGESALVTTGPAGGFIASGFALCRVPEINRVRWLINPFEFFTRAFALDLRPIPDTTTLSGRRIYFSHIDGDGWGNRSEVPIGTTRNPLAGRVLAERLFKTFPDLPVGLGLVGGELDRALGPVHDDALSLAREVLALPNVEVAAHGYSHPLRWAELEDYDRDAEIAEIDAIRQRNAKPPILRGLDWVGQRLQESQYDLVFFDGEVPRVFVAKPFSLGHEITEALDLASTLAPKEKRAQTFYWTGDARPFEAAIKLASANGVTNMNGGDSRFDGLFPSVAYLSPLSRQVGNQRQIYSGNANEVLFTDGWTKDFHGQLRMLDTVERTGSPRRLKPYNLYYHTFSGEKHASLRALTRLHKLAETDEFIPVWPSRYIAVANGFFQTRITEIGENDWRIENRGGLQTLRFDTDATLYIDTTVSTGVIGVRQVAGATYITLDPAVPVVRLRFADAPDGQVLLDNANWELSKVQRIDCGLRAKVTGFGAGKLAFTEAERGPWRLTAHRDEELVADIVAHSTGNGLRFALPDNLRAPLDITVQCRDGDTE